MEIKKIKIGIKTEQEALKEFADTFKKATAGDKLKRKRGVFFENINALRMFITPKRIELIRTIRKKRPQSTYELAQLVGRDVKSVMNDLTALKSLGLVTLKKETTEHRKKIHPLVDYSSVQVEIAV